MSDDDKEELLMMLFLIVVSAFRLIAKAWALIGIWTWFITPAWNLAPPSRAGSVGIVILISVLGDSESPADDENYIRREIKLLVTPFVLVGLAWCIKQIA